MKNPLKDKNLLFNIVKEVQKRGVIGEEDTILALLNKVMLRAVINADPVSSNVIVSDLSGGGKDFIVSALCKMVLPSSCYMHRTYLTPKVFVYWKQNWNGCVLHVEDPPADLLNGSVFKTMASGGSVASVVESQEVKHVEIIGKPVIIVTSMGAYVDIEGVRRWDSINMDVSGRLTKAVVNNGLNGFKANIVFNEQLCNALRDIPFKRVIVPFGDELVDLFGCNLILRTQYKKLLDYIKASAVLYQFQRSIDKDENVIATWNDYEYARFCFNKFNSVGGVALNVIEKEFLDLLEVGSFKSVKEIASCFSRSKMWIYRNMERLKSLGLIIEHMEFDNDANKEILFLSLSEFSNSNKLVSSKELCGNDLSFQWLKGFSDKLNDDRVKHGLPAITWL